MQPREAPIPAGAGESARPLWTAVSRVDRAPALVLGAAGLALYNWWLVVGLDQRLPSINSLFSEVSANGQPHAIVFQRLDIVAGLLLLAALVLRGPIAAGGPSRVLRVSMIVWAGASAFGGLFPFACAPTTEAGCQSAQWHFQLPAHHYLHMIAGVSEFAGVTVAILAAARMERLARLGKVLTVVLIVAYPLLAAAYLSEHLGSLVEPIFFVVFTVTAATALLV